MKHIFTRSVPPCKPNLPLNVRKEWKLVQQNVVQVLAKSQQLAFAKRVQMIARAKHFLRCIHTYIHTYIHTVHTYIHRWYIHWSFVSILVIRQ